MKRVAAEAVLFHPTGLPLLIRQHSAPRLELRPQFERILRVLEFVFFQGTMTFRTELLRWHQNVRRKLAGVCCTVAVSAVHVGMRQMREWTVVHPAFRDLGGQNFRRACPVLLHFVALCAAREKGRFIATRRITGLFLRRIAQQKNAAFEFFRRGHTARCEIIELLLQPFADLHSIHYAPNPKSFGEVQSEAA